LFTQFALAQAELLVPGLLDFPAGSLELDLRSNLNSSQRPTAHPGEEVGP